jgi:phosphonate transport system ATP-binding protein
MDTLADINRREGITVVVSLHQVEYARRYCPRTIALRNGAVVYDGPSEALTPEFLRTLYGDESEELVAFDMAPSASAPPDLTTSLPRAPQSAGFPALAGA